VVEVTRLSVWNLTARRRRCGGAVLTGGDLNEDDGEIEFIHYDKCYEPGRQAPQRASALVAISAALHTHIVADNYTHRRPNDRYYTAQSDRTGRQVTAVERLP